MKTKSLLLTALLSLIMLSCSWAQEKYEYAIVRQSGREILFISSDTIERDFLKTGRYEQIFQATLLKLNQLAIKWEIYNTTEIDMGDLNGYIYFLRRRVN